MLLALAAAAGKKLFGGAVKKAAKWVGGRVVGSAGKAVGKIAAAAANRPVLTAAATYAGSQVVSRMSGSAAPAFPQQFQQPASLPKRIGQRLIPGGKTGLEFTPYEGAEVDRLGRSIAVYPETRERLYAPPGYVIVRPWGPDGDAIAMLKGPARSMGLWHPDPKPPISGWDMRAINRANAAKKRVKKLSSKVGLTCVSKGRKKC